MEEKMNAVILAGGKGKRLAPYTTVYPKPMLPVGDRPILDIIIKQLAYFGFKNIMISVGYMAELIQAYYHNSNDIPAGVNIDYIKEKEPLGTAGVLSLIPEQKEAFIMINGDTLTTLNYRDLLNFHKDKNAAITIAAKRREVNIDFGVLKVNSKDVLRQYDEKPTLNYLVSIGAYVLDPEVTTYVKPNQRIDFPDIVKRLLKEGKKVQTYVTDEYWLDIGRPEDYNNATKCFREMKDQFLK